MRLGVALFMVLLGAGLIIGAVIYKNTAEERMNTWPTVIAVVVGNDRKEFTDDDGFSDYRYFRVVEYEVDGRKYRATDSESSVSPYTVGNSVTVHYNPDKPSECIFGAGDPLAYIVCYVVGGVFAAAGVAVAVLEFRRR
ncbi:MAG: DUF3592 domain-containing protein [Clostridia bacterium]|nr:DUF3592 domain-containing protein [Clostridia bacterium]